MTRQVEAVVVRKIEFFEEMDACVQLQQSVWQLHDRDVIPRRTFVVAQAVGGQVFGAWDGDTLAGYVLAIPGVRLGRTYLHSHMLAVSPEYRNRGIGAQLKFAQRDDALARGIDLIEWTFDPLQVKNAYLNLEKLGAIARRYSPDFYGHSESPTHVSLPTDRLHAEWWLKSKRVEAIVAGHRLPEYAIKETVSVTDNQLAPAVIYSQLQAPALELLLLVRSQFRAAFSSGLAALGFQSARDGKTSYLLGEWGEESLKP